MIDSHHGLILILRYLRLSLREKFNLQEVLVEFQKATFRKKNKKNWLFSNHCLNRLAQCNSLKLYTFIQLSFFVLHNKSAKICSNITGDITIQRIKMKKYEKVASFPCQGRKILWIHFLYSLPDLKHDQKRFLDIPSPNFPGMRALCTFLCRASLNPADPSIEHVERQNGSPRQDTQGEEESFVEETGNDNR